MLVRKKPRVCSRLRQPNESAGEVNEREEGLGEFVVARGDASELFDPCEEAFDQIAILIDVPIEGTRMESIGARRNHGLVLLRRNHLDEGVGVVALVGNDEVRWFILDQGRLIDIADYPWP